MTKERLEELIKQEKVIYTSRFKKPDKFKLYKDYFVDKNELWCLNKRIGICDCVIKLDKLFETKDQAEWHAKMAAERTERFEPPMWEDIKGYYRFNFMNCENGVWKKYSFELLKKQDDKAKEGGCISIWTGTKDIYNKTTPTKENYEKACEIVRDLFKGGKNEYLFSY